MSGLVAPLNCDCGAPIVLEREVIDVDDRGRRVAVGILACTGGHPWVDIRPIATPRPHPAAGPVQLELF